MNGYKQNKSSKRVFITAFIIFVFCFSIINIKTLSIVEAGTSTSYNHPALDVTSGAGEWTPEGFYFTTSAKMTLSGFKPLNNLESLTIAMWIMFDDETGYDTLFSQFIDNDNRVEVIRFNANVALKYSVGGVCKSHNSIAVYDDTLYFLVWTITEGGYINLYVNNVHRIQGDAISGHSLANDQLYVGCGSDGTAEFLQGEMYGLGFYTSVWSAEQRTTVYGNGYQDTLPISSDYGYYHAWDFQEGSGTHAKQTIIDISEPSTWVNRQYAQYGGIVTTDSESVFGSVVATMGEYSTYNLHTLAEKLESLTFEWHTSVITDHDDFYYLTFGFYEEDTWTEFSLWSVILYKFKWANGTVDVGIATSGGSYQYFHLGATLDIAVSIHITETEQYQFVFYKGLNGATDYKEFKRYITTFDDGDIFDYEGMTIQNSVNLLDGSQKMESKLWNYYSICNTSIFYPEPNFSDQTYNSNTVVVRDVYTGILLLDIIISLQIVISAIVTFFALIVSSVIDLVISSATYLVGGFATFITGLGALITNAFAVAMNYLIELGLSVIVGLIALFDALMTTIGLDITWLQIWTFVLYLPQFFGNILLMIADVIGYALSLVEVMFIWLDIFETYIVPHIATIQFYLYRYGVVGFIMVFLLVMNACIMSNSFSPLEKLLGVLKFIAMGIIGVLRVVITGMLFILQSVIILVRG